MLHVEYDRSSTQKGAHHHHAITIRSGAHHNDTHIKGHFRTDKLKLHTIFGAREGSECFLDGETLRQGVSKRPTSSATACEERAEHHRSWMVTERWITSLQRARMRWLEHFAGFLGRNDHYVSRAAR